MNKENETDWLKFYNDLDIEKELDERNKNAEKNDGIVATIRQYTTGSINGWFHKKYVFSKDVDRIVSYAIFDLKKDTMFLSKLALLEFIKEDQVNGIKRPDYVQQTYFTKQTFFQANVIYKTFLDQLENSLQVKPEAKPLPELPAIFADKNHLVNLVHELKKRGFVNEAGQWTGLINGSETDSGIGRQLVALSEVCRQYYRPKNKYYANELNQAWTKYFNYEMSPILWQPGAKDTKFDSYLRLFNFVDNIR